MKKGGSIYSARGSSQRKTVNLVKEETVPNADRDYGMMKTSHNRTPYPQPEKPVDLVALAAKLAEAEKSQSRVSINATIVRKSTKYEPSERLKIFNKRRKLFDEGEFTICKGRKLGDDFHPLNLVENELHFKALCAKIVERKSDSQNFDELAKYCRDNNLKIET